MVQRWNPLMRDTYKVNYDGACFAETDEAGIGVVVRNDLGQVMASLTEKFLCHLCAPKTRLLGWALLGLTIYLYRGLEFPTLGCSWHRDSTNFSPSLSQSSIFSPTFQQPPLLPCLLIFIAQ